MSEEERYVVSKIYENIQVDDRVTSDLDYCLYCQVTSRNEDHSLETLDYKITLDCINGNAVKQCPACKRIYILKDVFNSPFEQLRKEMKDNLNLCNHDKIYCIKCNPQFNE